MNIIWVFGSNDHSKEFKFSRIELMSAFASVTMWRHFYPDDKTFLYCDEKVKEYFTRINLIDIWDVVDTLYMQEQDIYNRKVFWTVDKIKMLGYIEPPFVFMDMDFYIKRKLPNFNNFDLVTAFEEYTPGYYPPYNDDKFKDITLPSREYFKSTAYNTCFYYVNKKEISEIYPSTCLRYMKEINDVDGINGNHSIFLEQYLLTALANKNKWTYSPLVNQQFNLTDRTWLDNIDTGFFSSNDIGEYFRHLDTDKKRLSNEKRSLDVQTEILILLQNYEPTKIIKLYNILNANN